MPNKLLPVEHVRLWFSHDKEKLLFFNELENAS